MLLKSIQGGTARVYCMGFAVLKVADNDILKSEAHKYIDMEIDEVSLYVPRCFAYLTFGRWHILVLSSCGDTTLKPFTIANGSRMKDDEIRQGGLQILGVLAYMHETCKMVHRDIKPENICVDKTGAWRLVDFGSAVYTNTNGESDALSSGNTLKYLPSEYILGRTQEDSPMLDVYALGIVMCELYGGVPFQPERDFRGDWNAFCEIVQGGSRQSLCLPTSMPPDLQTVVLKMLAPNRHNRYPTAREAYEALRANT